MRVEKAKKKETTTQAPEGENICYDKLEMEENEKEKFNSQEEEYGMTEEKEIQEVDLPNLIEIYGEKHMTNIIKEQLHHLQKELMRGKSKIGSTSRCQTN